MISNKYAKFLYPLGGLAIVWWGMTSVLKELKAETIAQNLLPVMLQLLCCLLVLILLVTESIKLWTQKKDRNAN
jgi:cell division protein FtsX